MGRHYPDLYILRHGETVWNAEERWQGRLNSPLTSRGIAQAEAQGRALAGLDLAGMSIWCSPQGRAFQTAAIALGGRAAAIRTDDRLCEIGMGDWQGRLRAGLPVPPDALDGPEGALGVYLHAPNGEGFAGVQDRVRPFLDTLDGPAVIVTHGITSRVLRLTALGWPLTRIAELPGGQGMIHCLRDGRQEVLEERDEGLPPAAPIG